MKYEQSDFTGGIPNKEARKKTMNKRKDVHENARLKELIKQAESLGEQKAQFVQAMALLDQQRQMLGSSLAALETAAAQLLPSSPQLQQSETTPALPPSAGGAMPPDPMAQQPPMPPQGAPQDMGGAGISGQQIPPELLEQMMAEQAGQQQQMPISQGY
jgi:hypothetical protein